MSSQFRNFKRFTRRLLDEALDTACRSFGEDREPARALDLTQLEQRVLMSASPAAAVVDAVETVSETGAVAIESEAPSNAAVSESNSGSTQTETAIQATVELVVIDPSAENHEELVADLQSQTDRVFEILVLDPREDGIAQITDALQDLQGVSAIHLVSHGDDGEILLGTSVLSQRNIDRYAAELVTWQYSMTADADLLIYGCDLTASADGVELTESLNTLLGTDVAASNDNTGNSEFGGDWDLETTVGEVETEVAFTLATQVEWAGLLTLNAYESFDYAAGDLEGQNGGSGWANGWVLTSGDTAQVSSTGLNSPVGGVASQGGAAQLSTTPQFTQSRDLITTLGADGTTAWFSFLFQPIGMGGGMSLVIGDGDGGTDTVNIGTAGNDFLLGVNNTALGTRIDDAATTGQTFFLVVQLDFAAGDDTITLYVDSSVGVSSPDSLPAATAVLTFADLGTFTEVGLIGGFDENFSKIDEIRVGSSFADVAPGGSQATLSATQDTYLVKNSNDSNYGASTSIVVDKSGGSLGNERGLIQFDVSTIPVGATITGATLQLEATAVTAAFDISVYQVSEAWTEGTQNAANGVASWDDRQTGTSWSTVGGTIASTTPVATTNAAAVGTQTWDVTGLVQVWFDGTETNNGLLLASPETGTESVTYASRESASGPQLIVTYSLPQTAPELSVAGSFTLEQINENPTANPGTLVSDLIASGGANAITDSDGDPEGIAVISVDDSSGTWQYSVDGGVAWNSFGAVSASSSVVLGDSLLDRVRYVPNADVSGLSTFTFRAWDRSDGSVSGATGVDASVVGGGTAFSAIDGTATVPILPVNVVLNFATVGDVTSSGAPGLDSWTNSQIVVLGDPGFAFEPGTSGTLFKTFDLNDYTGGTDISIEALHEVSSNITVGGVNGKVDLVEGDILFAAPNNSVTYTGLDLVSVAAEKTDVVRFRPSDESFAMVFDDIGSPFVNGFTLIEKDVLVGDSNLDRGDVLLNIGNNKDILLVDVTGAGSGNSVGTSSVLIAGADIGMGGGSVNIAGIDLIEEDISPGGFDLRAGQIVATLDGDDSDVGDNNITVLASDIFLLDVTTTSLGPTGTTAATATIMMEGADLNLESSAELLTALSYTVNFGVQNEPVILLSPGNTSFVEDLGAVLLDSAAVVSDVDSADFDGGILRIETTSNGTADDRISIRNQGGAAGEIGVAGADVSFEGTVIGTVSGGTGTAPLVVTFNSSADTTAVTALLQNLTFDNVSQNPSTGDRSIRYTMTDGDDGVSQDYVKTVNVQAGNDFPTAVTGDYSITEGTALTLDASGSTDPENESLTYEWDLNYDGTTFTADVTGEAPTVSWSTLFDAGVRAGDVTVALRASDATSTTSPVTATLTVISLPVTSISQTTTAIVPDGVIDAAWSGATPIVASQIIGNIDDTTDLSAQWRSTWDGENLYFLVEVTDDTIVNDSGIQPWNDDIVELYIDADNSRRGAYDGNDFEFGFRVNDPSAVHLGTNSVLDATGVTFQIVNSGSGYVAEISVPWTTLGVTPAAGANLGIEIHVVDDDDGGVFDGKLAWNDGLDQAFQDTSVFGKVELAPTAASAIIVDTTSDVDDGDTSSISSLYANKGADGRISLREAILAANGTTNGGTPDLILFEIADPLIAGAHTINLTSELPEIDQQVVIDGTTEGDFSGTPIVVLNGAGVATAADGLNLIAGSDGSTIRGLAVHSFTASGLRIDDAGNHTIVGNYFGTDAGGVLDLGNAIHGIHLVSSDGNAIGGALTGERNVVIGNSVDGIHLNRSDSNVVLGNYVGLTADGLLSVGNDDDGVEISGSSTANVIGRSGAGESNVVVGNGVNGIEFSGTSSTNLVQGNLIGISPGGLTFGNGGSGISLHANTTSNTIGGTGAGEGNQIANNSAAGISTDGNAALSSSNIAIVGNSISGNGGLGIDTLLDGVSIQASMPEITSADVSGTDLIVAGTVTGTAGATYEIAFYASAAEDASGHGEAERFLGTIDVAIPPTGSTTATFSQTLAGAGVAIGEFVTATARTAGFSTTEFAENVQAAALNGAPTALIAPLSGIAEGDDLVLDGSGSSDPDANTLSYEWDVNYNGTSFSADFTTETVTLDWAQLSALGISDDGTYQIALRVNDGVTNSAISVASLTVTNVAPTISVTGDSGVGSGQVYTLALNYSDAGDDTVQSWTVNWGDGTIDTFSGTQATTSHVYTNDGFTNHITFSVTDDDGTYENARLAVASPGNGNVYFNVDGAETTTGVAVGPTDVVQGPDGYLYVAGYTSNLIVRLDPDTGAFVDTFVIREAGGLTNPARIAFAADGTLFVTSYGSDQILRFGNDGRFLGEFGSGLTQPDGLVFDGEGNLYVSSRATGDIFKYDGETAAQIGTGPFASFGQATIIDLNIGPNGHLFASSGVDNLIREFDTDGNVVGDFGGSALADVTSVGGFNWGPDGRVYVTDSASDKIGVYEADGTFVRSFGSGLSSPLNLMFTADLSVLVNAAPAVVGETYNVNEGAELEITTVADWASPSWKQRQEIAFDNSANPDTLNDFSFVVKIHATAADAVNIDYSSTQDGGEDLRFVDADGTLLKHEIEAWDETGYSYVWVNVPVVAASTTSDFIWVYYDHEQAADGHSENQAWNADYSAVYHLNGTSLESTSNNNNGALVDVVDRPGIVAGAGEFNGTSSQINLGSDATLDDVFDGGGTISAWINPDGSGENGFGRILDKASSTFGGGGNGDGWAFQLGGVDAGAGYLIFEQGFSGGKGEWRTAAGSVTQGIWQHVVVTYDSSTASSDPKVYINGVLQALTEFDSPIGTARSDAALDLTLGNHSLASTRTFDGLIDEVRISQNEISAAQIAAEYANVTGSFVTSTGVVESGPGGLLSNDSDREGNPLTVNLVTGPAHATSFSLNADGSFNYDHDGSETSNDTFTYTVTDGTTTSAPVTVNLAIAAVDDAPTISSVSNLSSPEDGVIGPIAVSVSDAESTDGSLLLTATSSDQTLIANSGIVVGGSGSNRTITLTPVANATGGPTTITLTVSDGAESTSTTFEVTITALDDAPTITSIANQTTGEDSPVGPIGFTVGDAETSAGALVVTAISADQSLVRNADITITGAGANRTIGFTPMANAFGGPATITVRVFDGVQSTDTTFDVTVTPSNDAPELSVISNQTVNEDAMVGPLSFTIGDVDHSMTDLVITASSSDQSVINDADIVLAGAGAGRTIALTPVANASGVATITLSVSDGVTSTTRTFDATVLAVNDAPTISNIPNVTTDEDTTVGPYAFTVDDAENDSDTLILTATSSDQNLIFDADIVLGGAGSSRTISVTPTDNAFGGPATITVSVFDGTVTTTEMFNVTVTAVNDVPTISKIPNVTVDEDTTVGPYTFTVGDVETANGPLVVTATSSDQSLILDADIILGGSGSARTISVTPVANAFGGPATITVSVSDGTETTTETFEVTVTGVNDAPAISNIPNVTVDEDTTIGPYVFTIGDAEAAAAGLMVSATSSDQSLILDSDIVLGGSGASRTISVTPVANAFGGPVIITVIVSDGTTTTTETFDVTVVAVNDRPNFSAIPDVTIVEDTISGVHTFTIGDVETAAESLIVTAFSGDQSLIADADITLGGTGANRQISAVPVTDAFGTTTITVVVSDGVRTRSKSFDLTVTPDNDTPQISALPALAIQEDTAVANMQFEIGDVETPAKELVVFAVSSDQTLISDSQLSVAGTGKNRRLNFVPVSNAFGVTTITLTVTDGFSTSESKFDVVVDAVNDAPHLSSIVTHTYTSGGIAGVGSDAPGLLAGVTDAESDSLSVIASEPANGTVVVKDDGSFVYEPDIGYFGTDSFTFVVSDGDRVSKEGVVNIVVPISVSAPGQQQPSPEPESAPNTEPSPEAKNAKTSDVSDNEGVSDVLPAPNDNSDDDEHKYVPPPASQAEDDERTTDFTAVELTSSNQEFLFRQEVTISTSEIERVRAQTLRSLEQLVAARLSTEHSLLHDPVQKNRTSLQFSYERFTELKETVDQIDEFQENLNAANGMTAMAEEVLVVGATSIVVGSIITAVQSGMLALGFLSQLPAWTLFDPLMVMDGVNGDDDGDSLQDIVDRQAQDEPPVKV